MWQPSRHARRVIDVDDVVVTNVDANNDHDEHNDASHVDAEHNDTDGATRRDPSGV